jgi:hypothetical protein
VACLLLLLLFLNFVPHLVSGRGSLREADERCYELNGMRIGEEGYYLALLRNTSSTEFAEADPSSGDLFRASVHAKFAFRYNLLSCYASIICEILWVFWSPHLASSLPVGKKLDNDLGAYYGMQVVGNSIVLVFSYLKQCTPSRRVTLVSEGISIATLLGVCIFFTNLLLHHYLVDKAKMVVSETSDRVEQNRLAKLGQAFQWELWVMWIVPPAVVVAFFGHRLGFIDVAIPKLIGFFGLVVVCLSDFIFSVLVTRAFVHALGETQSVLSIAGRSTTNDTTRTRSSVLHQKVKLSRWFALLGCGVAVTSSSLFYINMLWYLPRPELRTHESTESFLNPFAFGSNVDSVLNDVGVMMCSGMFLNIGKSLGGWWDRGGKYAVAVSPAAISVTPASSAHAVQGSSSSHQLSPAPPPLPTECVPSPV